MSAMVELEVHQLVHDDLPANVRWLISRVFKVKRPRVEMLAHLRFIGRTWISAIRSSTPMRHAHALTSATRMSRAIASRAGSSGNEEAVLLPCFVASLS